MKRLLLLAAVLLSCSAMAQEISLSTNLADYAGGGTLNIEAAYGFARHWSAGAGIKYNPFSFGRGEEESMLRQRLISAGTRWWPWHIFSGWWMGAKLQYQEFAQGGIVSPETTEGDRFGGGISAGYSAMIGKHFNLDFGFGLWGGYSVYSVYACQNCGRRLASGTKAFLLPNDLILGISYIF